jgi:hypothetical protein
MADPVIVADVCSLTLRSSEQPAYDQPFELQDLYMDARTGASMAPLISTSSSRRTADVHRQSPRS